MYEKSQDNYVEREREREREREKGRGRERVRESPRTCQSSMGHVSESCLGYPSPRKYKVQNC